MNYLLALFFILSFFAAANFAQSGRVTPKNTPLPDSSINQVNNLAADKMLDEASAYAKNKFAEYDQKKMPYSDLLYRRTVLEQKQMAAKYAAALAGRPNLTNTDFYYLGMLHWLADNNDSATESLRKYLASENPAAEKLQASRSVMVIVLARRKNFEEAEKILAEYLKTEPIKLSDRSKMETELATSYEAEKIYARAAPHAEEAYRAIKILFKDAAVSRTRALNDLLNAGLKVFEIYRADNKQSEADAALEDLRKTAVSIESNAIFYAAVDQKIKYLIETRRKPIAMQTYEDALAQASKDFSSKTSQEDITRRLKRREKHYKLLGENAPELADVARWLSGATPQNFAALRGKVVLLDFWATWCAPCIDAFPSLIEWHQNFQKDGLVILGVTRYYGDVKGIKADEAAEFDFLRQFNKTHNLPYDSVVARGQANQINYGATGIPTTVLIDRKGIVRYIEVGASASRQQEIEKEIEKLLAEK
jgi:thiol-disulfide isomerase/thioredoxin